MSHAYSISFIFSYSIFNLSVKVTNSSIPYTSSIALQSDFSIPSICILTVSSIAFAHFDVAKSKSSVILKSSALSFNHTFGYGDAITKLYIDKIKFCKFESPLFSA